MKIEQPRVVQPASPDRGDLSVFEAIKREIILGELRPRERLVEEELAERFQVGRHTIRGALEALEHAGLAERRPNRGARVRDYADDEIEALYDMRELLHEAAVQRMKFPADERLINELETINDAYRQKLEARDLGAAVAVNDRFHRTLFASCGNPHLEETIEAFWLKTATIHSYALADPTLAMQSLAEHVEIIEAVKAGDRTRLTKACNDHMYPAVDAYRRVNVHRSRNAGVS